MASPPAISDATMAEHQRKVQRIVEQVKAKPEGQLMSIRKDTATHQIHDRPWKTTCHPVDVSDLNGILGYVENVSGRLAGEIVTIAVCEPQVQMDQLSKHTLPFGLVPQVVPEYSNFTVGGLINGEGIQSSSFRYGVFSHTVTEIEIVLGDDSVVVCNEKENRDLFIEMPESLGTLGIITRANVALRPAKPWVRTEYQLFTDLDRFYIEFGKAIRSQQGDFLEGLALSKGRYMIIHSFFEDDQKGLPVFRPYPLEPAHGEKYYYQYIAQDVCNQSKPSELVFNQDVIPTFEFLFRGMRGAWWMIECHVGMPFLMNQRWFRKIVDKEVQKELLTRGFAATPNFSREQMERCFCLQDMGIFLSRLKEGVKFVESKIGVYPLWFCPVDLRRNIRESRVTDNFEIEDLKDEYVVDMGIYGEPTVQPYYRRKIMPELQKYVDCPSIWGVCYHMSKDDIRTKHDPMRKKYKAIGAFPGLEDKITPPKLERPDGPIFAWRMVRDHGPYWPVKVGLLFAAVGVGTYGLFKLGGMAVKAVSQQHQ